MSVVTLDGDQVELLRDPEAFTRTLHRNYAGDDPMKSRDLAIVVLKANGWSLREIKSVFGLCRGHLSRIIQKTETELAEIMLEESKHRSQCQQL